MAKPDLEIWNGVLAQLRANQPTLCRQWFEDLEPLGLVDGMLHLRARSNAHRDYLRRRCNDSFNEAARDITGRLIAVRFLGPDDAPRAAQTINGHPPPDASPVLRDDSLALDPDYTFENFIEGPGNHFAKAAAQAVASNPGRAYNPLFIHGGVGLGKTHLLQAVCLQLAQTSSRISIYYISCEGFVSHLMQALQDGQMNGFRHRFRDVDLLVIDDIQFLATRERTQEEFFHTFESLHKAQKPIILSSDAPPDQIPDLEERLVSRFCGGLVADVKPPCFETRVAIVKSKAALRGLNIPDDVAAHIATIIDANIRELEGAISKLQMQSIVDERPIDLELAETALGKTPKTTFAAPTVQTIIETVTDYYSVRLADLQSKRRNHSIALPRQVCMYLARRHTRHSLQEIGGYFGGRDHTTVMHAVKTVEARREQDPEFDGLLESLESRTRQSSSYQNQLQTTR